jgi:hypothetical protein
MVRGPSIEAQPVPAAGWGSIEEEEEIIKE